MRRRLLWVIGFIGISLALYAVDKPAATVNLIKPEIISVKQLDKTFESLLKLGVKKTKQEVLESMINDILLKQGAEKEGIKVKDSEVIAQIRKQLQAQGISVTDDQMKTLIMQRTGLTWEKYLEQGKNALMLKYYVEKKKKSILDNVKPPSEKEIVEIFHENEHQLINPDMIRLSHIFFDTRNLNPDEKKKAYERAQEVYAKIQNGSASFKELVTQSDDPSSRYKEGDIGYLSRTDTRAAAQFGKDFIDAVFSLKKGEVSKVIESNLGYHILLVTDKREKKFLKLDDPILPTTKETVRERIVSAELLKKEQEQLQKAVKELVADLRKQAEVNIFEENID